MKLYAGTKESWNAFVAANAEDGGVLQSWEWGEFQESLGRKVWRLSWGEGQIEGACLLVEHRLPFGFKYFYAPRGPVMNAECRMQNAEFMNEFVRFAKEKKVSFLRIEPPHENFKFQVSNSQYRSVVPVQPMQTLRIDLTQSGDELLTAMHEKTRYNIRLGEKHGVQVENSKSEILNSKQIQNSKFETFFTLMQETAKRDGFQIHTKEHYQNLLNAPICLLFNAQLDNKVLATALIAFFGTTAYYLHGASANEHRDCMAPYALHWNIMQEAKRRGCRAYDLWGVDEKRWPGVTRFKKGFAPKTSFTTYVGTHDIPIRPLMYFLYKLWKLFR